MTDIESPALNCCRARHFHRRFALAEAVRKSMRQVRTAIGATTINPNLLTCAEKLLYDGYLRRRSRLALERIECDLECLDADMVKERGEPLMRKLLKRQGFAPSTIVTDKLGSYGAAKKNLSLHAVHEQGLRRNNRC